MTGKRFAALTATAALAAAVLTPTSAQAAILDGNCDGTEFCLFDWTGGAGNPTYDVRSTVNTYVNKTYVGKPYADLDNTVSYIINRMSSTVSVYEDPYCFGAQAKLASGYNKASTTWWNNRPSSNSSPDNPGC